jgi:hypothetical protein
VTGADIARRTRSDQGLAEHVEDEGVLAQIAQLLNATNAGPNNRRSPKSESPSDAKAS